MKRVMGKFKQQLSVLLAVAMIVTMIPQTSMAVSAAETNAEASADEAVTYSEDTETTAEEITEDGGVDSPAASGKEGGAEEETDPETDTPTDADAPADEDGAADDGKTQTEGEAPAEEDGALTEDDAAAGGDIEEEPEEEEETVLARIKTYAEGEETESEPKTQEITVKTLFVEGETTKEASENATVSNSDPYSGNSYIFDVGLKSGYKATVEAVSGNDADDESKKGLSLTSSDNSDIKDSSYTTWTRYTISDISDVTSMTITVTLTKILNVKVNTRVSGNNSNQYVVNVTGYKVSGGDGASDTGESIGEDDLSVSSGNTLTLTYTVKNGYKQVVTVSSNNKEENKDATVGSSKDDTTEYTLEISNITADTLVTITAVPVPVTITVSANEAGSTPSTSGNNVEIVSGVWTSDEDASGSADGYVLNKIYKGEDISFTVTPAADEEITKVTYKLTPDGKEETLTGTDADDGSKTYTIKAETVGEADQVDIVVSVKILKKYTVKFSPVQENAELTVKDVTSDVNEKVVNENGVAINENGSLSFTVSAVSGNEGLVVTGVSVSGNENHTMEPVDGVYTYTPEDGDAADDGNVTILVDTRAKDRHTVKFVLDNTDSAGETNNAAWSTVSGGDFTIKYGSSTSAVNTNVTVSGQDPCISEVKEKDKVYFSVSGNGDTLYSVASVEVSEGADTLTVNRRSGVYTLTAGEGTGEVTVTIKTELDKEKANKVSWTAADGTKKNSYTVEATTSGNNVSGKSYYGSAVVADDGSGTYYTEGEEVVLKVSGTTYYAVDSVTGNNVRKDSYGKYVINATKDGTEAVISTSVKEVDEDGLKVNFINKSSNSGMTYGFDAKVSDSLQYSQDSKGNIYKTYKGTKTQAAEKVPESSDTWNYLMGEERIAFTVTVPKAMKDSYVPIVYAGKDKSIGKIGGSDPEQDKKGNAVYTYDVMFGEMDDASVWENWMEDGITIVIDEEPITYPVTVRVDPRHVSSVDARVGAETIKYTDVTDNNGARIYTYDVINKGTLTVTPTMYDNCAYISADVKITTGGVAKTVSAKTTSITATVNGTKEGDGAEITIASMASYRAAMAWGKSNISNAEELVTVSGQTITKNSTYSVPYTGSVYVMAQSGYVAALGQLSVSGNTQITEAVIKDGSKAVAGGNEDTKFNASTDSSKAGTIVLGKNQEGKTLTVTLYTGEGEEKTAIVTFKLKVASKPEKVELSTGTGISQAAGTTYTYALKADAKTVDWTQLKAEVSGNDGSVIKSVAIEGSSLKVTTSIDAKEDATKENPVNIQIIDTLKADGSNVVGTIPLTITAAALPKTTVKETEGPSDDVELSLKLSVKAKDTQANVDTEQGDLWYYIQAVPKPENKNLQEVTAEDVTGNNVLTFYRKVNGTAAAGGDAAVTKSGTTSRVVYLPVLDEGKTNASSYIVTVQTVIIKDSELSEESKAAYEKEDTQTAITPVSKGKDTVLFTGASTLASRYETSLKLTKGTTTVYTGQADVKIATPKFSTTTTYRGISAVADLSCTGEEAISVSYNDGTIEANIPTTAKTGTHKIQVTAVAPEGSVGSSATISITVKKGIENLSINTPSTRVYKQDNKASTLKFSVNYNEGLTKAAKQSVTWAVYGKADTDSKYAEESDAEEEELTDSEQPYYEEYTELLNSKSGITIKNGTVTIAKNYVVGKNQVVDDTFIVVATANDYTGESLTGTDEDGNAVVTRKAYSAEVSITAESITVGSVVVLEIPEELINSEDYFGRVTIDGEGSSDYSYEVIARKAGSVAEVTADKLYDFNSEGGRPKAVVVALNKGTPEKDAYTLEELFGTNGYAIDPADVTFKSSNTKALTVDSEGVVTGVLKTANKIKLTATANDGKKSAADMQLSVVTPSEKVEYGLIVRDAYGTEYPLRTNTEASSLKLNATAGTTLFMEVVQIIDDENSENGFYTIPLNASTNTFSVAFESKNAASVAKSGAFAQNYSFYLKNQKTKITIKTTQKLNGKNLNDKYVFYLEGSNVETAAAPTATLLDKGTVTAGKTVEQTLSYQLTQKNGKKTVAYEKKTKGAYVLVQGDPADMYKNAANQAKYEALAKSLDGNSIADLANGMWMYIDDKDDSGRANVFSLNFKDTTNLPSGSYKLKLTYGEVDDIYNFIAKTATAALTVKVGASAAKKPSYKVTSSYTLSVVDSDKAALAGKATGLDNADVEFIPDKVMNENGTYIEYNEEGVTKPQNIMKSNGQPGEFTNYFEVVQDKDGTSYVKLKDTVSGSDIDYLASKDSVNDRKAYVSYRMVKGAVPKSGYVAELEGTALITVNVKKAAAAKYAIAGTVTVENGVSANDEITVTIPVTKGGVQTKLSAAFIVGSNSKYPNSLVLQNGKKEEYRYVSAEAVEGGIQLKITAPEAEKDTYKTFTGKSVTIYVMPEDSYYASRTNTAAVSGNDWVSQCVKLTTKLTVKENGSSGITVANAKLKQTLAASNYVDYTNAYVIEVPYTRKTSNTEITSVTTVLDATKYSEFNDGEGNENGGNSVVKVEDVSTGNVLRITVDKYELSRLMTTKSLKNNKTFKATATLGFKYGTSKQNVIFTLTTPKSAAQSYSDMEKIITGLADKGTTLDSWWFLDECAKVYVSSNDSPDEVFSRNVWDKDPYTLARIKQEAAATIWSVLDEITYDSDGYAYVSGNDVTFTVSGNEKREVFVPDVAEGYMMPKLNEDGTESNGEMKLTVVYGKRAYDLSYENRTDGDNSDENSVTITVKLAYSQMPSDLQKQLTEHADWLSKQTLTNETGYEQIQSEARDCLGIKGSTNLKFELNVGDDDFVDATDYADEWYNNDEVSGNYIKPETSDDATLEDAGKGYRRGTFRIWDLKSNEVATASFNASINRLPNVYDVVLLVKELENEIAESVENGKGVYNYEYTSTELLDDIKALMKEDGERYGLDYSGISVDLLDEEYTEPGEGTNGKISGTLHIENEYASAIYDYYYKVEVETEAQTVPDAEDMTAAVYEAVAGDSAEAQSKILTEIVKTKGVEESNVQEGIEALAKKAINNSAFEVKLAYVGKDSKYQEPKYDVSSNEAVSGNMPKYKLEIVETGYEDDEEWPTLTVSACDIDKIPELQDLSGAETWIDKVNKELVLAYQEGAYKTAEDALAALKTIYTTGEVSGNDNVDKAIISKLITVKGISEFDYKEPTLQKPGSISGTLTIGYEVPENYTDTVPVWVENAKDETKEVEFKVSIAHKTQSVSDAKDAIQKIISDTTLTNEQATKDSNENVAEVKRITEEVEQAVSADYYIKEVTVSGNKLATETEEGTATIAVTVTYNDPENTAESESDTENEGQSESESNEVTEFTVSSNNVKIEKVKWTLENAAKKIVEAVSGNEVSANDVSYSDEDEEVNGDADITNVEKLDYLMNLAKEAIAGSGFTVEYDHIYVSEEPTFSQKGNSFVVFNVWELDNDNARSAKCTIIISEKVQTLEQAAAAVKEYLETCTVSYNDVSGNNSVSENNVVTTVSYGDVSYNDLQTVKDVSGQLSEKANGEENKDFDSSKYEVVIVGLTRTYDNAESGLDKSKITVTVKFTVKLKDGSSESGSNDSDNSEDDSGTSKDYYEATLQVDYSGTAIDSSNDETETESEKTETTAA